MTGQNQAFDLLAPARRLTPAPAGDDSTDRVRRQETARRAADRRARALRDIDLVALMAENPRTSR